MDDVQSTKIEYATFVCAVDRNQFVQAGQITPDVTGESTVYYGTFPEFSEQVAFKEGRVVAIEDMKEVEYLIQCNHTNILRVYGLVRISPDRFVGYFMEYLKRGNLSSVIHSPSQTYSWGEIHSWTKGIASGLAHLHSVNIIHRDIKPTNLLLASRTLVKIADMGVSRKLSANGKTMTAIIGTAAYMAPELMFNKTYNYAVDTYSFSITLWEIIHRKEPCDGEEIPFHFMNRVIKGERPPIDTSLNSAIVELLQRGWHDDPDKRPALSEFAGIIEQARQDPLPLSDHIGGREDVLSTDTETSEISEDDQDLNHGVPSDTPLLMGGCGPASLNGIVVMDAETNEWHRLTLTIPYKSSSHGTACLNGELYVFGGFDGSDYFKSTYKLKRSLEWERLTDMDEERGAIANSSVVFEGGIWVMGGWNINGTLKSVRAYDPMTNSWSVKPEMTVERGMAAAVVAMGKIFICGGVFEYTYHSTVEVFDPPAPQMGCLSFPAGSFIYSGCGSSRWLPPDHNGRLLVWK